MIQNLVRPAVFAPLLLAAIALITLRAHAFTVSFPFTANSNAVYAGSDTNLTGAVITPFSAHLSGTAANANRIGTFGGQPCLVLTSSATTAAAAVAANQYLEFTLQPQPGYTMTLFSFSLDAAKTLSASGRGFTMRTSESGYAAEFWPAGQEAGSGSFANFSASFTNGVSVSYSNLNHAVTLRLYIYNGSAATVNIRNVVITGITTAPPPPPPVFTSISVDTTNVILSGTNGPINGNYYLLGGSNMTQAPATWTRLSTNSFDNAGNFTLTNTLAPDALQNFYRLQVAP